MNMEHIFIAAIFTKAGTNSWSAESTPCTHTHHPMCSVGPVLLHAYIINYALEKVISKLSQGPGWVGGWVGEPYTRPPLHYVWGSPNVILKETRLLLF